MSDEPQSDQDLVKLFLDGDASGFDEIFRKYNRSVRALCIRVLGDVDTAEDLVQETFIKVIKALDYLDDDFNFSGWIHRVATNACMDEIRRRQRRLQRQVDAGEYEQDALLRSSDDDAMTQPEKAYELQQLRRLIWDVSASLPARQRTALTMRELQGLSYASIARFMKTSESAVETLLHRARRRFREQFYKLEGPTELPGVCAEVARLAAEGPAVATAEQRKLVADHVQSCSWCREWNDV